MATEWNEPAVAMGKKFEEEDADNVKDDWDVSDDEEKPVAAPSKPTSKKPAKKQTEVVDIPDLSKMSEKQREAYIAEQEMRAAGYDLAGNTSTMSGLLKDVNTTEDAATVGKEIGELLMRKYGAKEAIYRNLLLSIVLEAGKNMASKDLRHVSNTLKAAADESKQKEDTDKKAKDTGKKGPKVKLATKANDNELDDYSNFPAAAGGGRNDIDDDFM